MGKRGRRKNYKEKNVNKYIEIEEGEIKNIDKDSIIQDNDDRLIELCENYRDYYIYLKYVDVAFVRGVLENLIRDSNYYGKIINYYGPYYELGKDALNILLDEYEMIRDEDDELNDMSPSKIEDIILKFVSMGVKLTKKYFIVGDKLKNIIECPKCPFI